MCLQVNLHSFIPRSRANGPGERAVVWVQGCPRRCEGCFNPGSQPFGMGLKVFVDDLELDILQIRNSIDGVTFSGGEPFAQAKALAELAKRLQKSGLSVVCYTGYTLKELRAGNREDWNALLEQIDLLIDGPFIQSEQCREPYRGSANQKLHFLSGRIKPEEVSECQIAEFTLGVDGIKQTGFPELPNADDVFAEAAGIIGGNGNDEKNKK